MVPVALPAERSVYNLLIRTFPKYTFIFSASSVLPFQEIELIMLPGAKPQVTQGAPYFKVNALPVSYTHLDVYKRQMLDNRGLKGLPCGTPFLRLVSLPFMSIGTRNHLRIRRSVM